MGSEGDNEKGEVAKRHTILVVTADEAEKETIKLTLGCEEILVANSGQQALGLLRKSERNGSSPDLVITRVSLDEDMSGIAFLTSAVKKWLDY